VHLGHFADGTGLNPLAGEADAFAGMALIAHLRDAVGFLRDITHRTRFGDGVGERLLDIDVTPGTHGHDAGRRMDMVRRGDEHGVDVLLLLDQFAVVAIQLRPGIFFDRSGGVIEIHIAQRDDVREAGRVEIANVAPALTADADAAEVHLFTRRRESRAADDVRGTIWKPKTVAAAVLTN
jgi:hypothetical protein